MPQYTTPGQYVAICWGRGDERIAKVFTLPTVAEQQLYLSVPDEGATASWWYLNWVTGVDAVDAVYPLSTFRAILELR